MPEVEEGQFSTEGSVHLDALRGLAALVVVLGHTRSLYFSSTSKEPAATAPPTAATAILPGSPAGLPLPSTKITIGNEAVMIFFVLSGFLVGGSVLRSFRKNRFSWSDYLTKRLTRLWVVLIPALIMGFAIDHAGLAHFGANSIYGSPPGQLIVVGDLASRLGIPTLLGNLFFTQGILVEDFGVNESLWSLTFEFWYYILFPLMAVVLLSRWKLTGRSIALVCFAAISYFVGPIVMLHFPIWILGAGVAWLPSKLTERMARVLALVMAVILILLMPVLRAASVKIYVAEWVMAIGSGCLIYFVKHLESGRRPDWYSAVSGFFSRISYTLYLVHLPLAVFLCAALNRPWHIWAKTGGNLAIWLATDVAVIVVAYGFYRLFEAV
jgi:peptidoglycan/LPS O-acetylase OafA/YrhL